jgi:hypothetical protein
MSISWSKAVLLEIKFKPNEQKSQVSIGIKWPKWASFATMPANTWTTIQNGVVKVLPENLRILSVNTCKLQVPNSQNNFNTGLHYLLLGMFHTPLCYYLYQPFN